MAQRCEICGKGPSVGQHVSHAHKLTKRRWLPNLVAMRAVVAGRAQRVRVCTRCLKAGKVTKVDLSTTGRGIDPLPAGWQVGGRHPPPA